MNTNIPALATVYEATGFSDKWKGLVENTIYALIEDGYRRGVQSPPREK